MKIYTKGGDKGKTSLFDGTRIYKDDIRVESYGNVDELNSFIGVLVCSLEDQTTITLLQKIQSTLFSIGSILAAGENPSFELQPIQAEPIELLESSIDNYESHLPKLTNFILPGGNVASGHAHVCRTICRRAERRIISLSKEQNIDSNIIKYLNRLSDYFFVLSRKLVYDAGDDEVIWTT